MQAGPETGRWFVAVVLLAGVVGGMAWAGIVALLRDRFNASEILVSLMLVYVADMLLGYLVYGPWKDPPATTSPQTITFRRHAGARLRRRFPRPHRAADRARRGGGLLGAAVPHLRRLPAAGGRGLAPAAARVMLASPRAALWMALLLSGRHGGPGGCPRGGRAAGSASRPTCRPATASPPSSSPSSGGCIRWARSSRPS